MFMNLILEVNLQFSYAPITAITSHLFSYEYLSFSGEQKSAVKTKVIVPKQPGMEVD